MNFAKNALWAFAGALGMAAACAPSAREDAEGATFAQDLSVSTSALSAQGEALWEAHVREATAEGDLQPDCVPRRAQPPLGTEVRGVVVFFHGFTACPQQFFDLSKDLTAAGYEVLIPLLPGQGRVPDGLGRKRHDDISDLPVRKTKERYVDLAKTMGAIVADARGAHVVGGLSVGGLLATVALEESPSVWHRGLLFAPFFEPPGMSRFVTHAAAILAPRWRHSWGKECKELQMEPEHRAGICEFTFNHLQACADLGRDALSKTSRIQVPVQMLGVESDSAADNGRIVRALGGMADAQGCFYPKGTPHSFVSAYDHRDMAMEWLPLFQRQVVAFVENGARPKIEGQSSEHGYPRCAVQ